MPTTPCGRTTSTSSGSSMTSSAGSRIPRSTSRDSRGVARHRGDERRALRVWQPGVPAHPARPVRTAPQRPATAAERQSIIELAAAVVDHRIELMPDVGPRSTSSAVGMSWPCSPRARRTSSSARSTPPGWPPLRQPAHRRREDPRHLPRTCPRARAEPGDDLDDRQLAAVRHPGRPAGRLAGGVHPAPGHLGPRGGRARPRRPGHPAPRQLRRPAAALLRSRLGCVWSAASRRGSVDHVFGRGGGGNRPFA